MWNNSIYRISFYPPYSDYLWLLSRTPTLPEEAILFLLTKAKERGYNTSMLKWVKQKHENQK